MAQIKVKLNYRRIKLNSLEALALLVLAGIYNNALVFVTPPILQPAFLALVNDFISKLAAYRARTLSKAEFDLSKEALINGLNILATYTDSIALGDATIISLAGFEPTKASFSNINPPVQPTGVTLVRGSAGQLLADCNVVANADMYGTILTAGEPLSDSVVMNGLGQLLINESNGGGAMPAIPVPATLKGILDVNKARKKTFINLQAGITYYVYYWAMNAGGVSSLSVGVSRLVIEE